MTSDARDPVVMYTLYKTDGLEVAAPLACFRRVVAKEDGVPTLLDAIEDQRLNKKLPS